APSGGYGHGITLAMCRTISQCGKRIWICSASASSSGFSISRAVSRTGVTNENPEPRTPNAEPRTQTLLVCSTHHDLLDPDVRRAVRDAVGLRRRTLRVAARAEHLPRLLAVDEIQVRPEVGRDRVVGDVGPHARHLGVLALPEAVAAELDVVPRLVARV